MPHLFYFFQLNEQNICHAKNEKRKIGVIRIKWVKRDSYTDVKNVVLTNMGIQEKDLYIDENKVFRIDNLDDAKDMILEGIKNGEEFTVVGDYDVDGVTATSIMLLTLISLKAKVKYRIPKRISEGYGISEKIIDEIDSGIIITVDNGIAAIEAIKKAKEKGLKVIVIDHHLKNENGILPDADIIIDPNAIENSAEFNGYCGAGLAYRVAEILVEDKKLLEKLLCFASLGTIADVMQLKSENRRIVKDGLQNMVSFGKRTSGLASILSSCELNKHITATDVAFKIGPMLNAPGRLYDDGAKIAVEALVYDGKYKEDIGLNLIKINEERKAVVKESVEKVKENISCNCLYGDFPLIIYEPGLNEGIVGIIAGRLAEEQNIPVIVFTDTEDEKIIKGSARSAQGVHLKNLLDKCSDKIYKYGGHAEAAGISIEKDKLYDFMDAMRDNVEEPDTSIPNDIVYYDLEIDANDLKRTFSEVQKYEPYGEGNPKIVFKIKDYKLSPRYSGYYKTLGDGTHIKLFGVGSSAIWFSGAKEYFDLKEPKQVDIIGKLSCSYFRDMPELQVEVIDLKDATQKIEKSALGKRLEELAKKRYEKEKKNDEIPNAD